jgi:hypothetical protein
MTYRRKEAVMNKDTLLMISFIGLVVMNVGLVGYGVIG